MNVGKKVVLLGIDSPIALTIIRELGENGVVVYGIGRSSNALGRYSRFLHRAFVRPRGATATIELIDELASAEGVSFLMAISEPDILMIHERKRQLGAVKALVPPLEPLSIVLDKMATLELAREVDIEVPRIWTVHSESDIDEVGRSATYPVVLKWKNPIEVIDGLSRLGVEPIKAEYCYRHEELARALRRYVPLGKFPVVQSYAPGHGLGQMIFMHEGEPLLKFQHRRIAEWPPEGGFSVVCEGLPDTEHTALMSKSIELLRRIEWVGAAMVEYRYDPETDRAVLMEVNGRFWGSLPLAYHSGALFAWMTYSVLGLGEVPSVTGPRAWVRCRFVAPELKRLFRIAFAPGRIQNRELRFNLVREVMSFFVRFASFRYRYYVFSIRDPLPCFADLWFGLARFLGKLRQRGSAFDANTHDG